MKLSYEETPIGAIHARDFTETTNRSDVKRRLDFITAKLANKALDQIDLFDLKK